MEPLQIVSSVFLIIGIVLMLYVLTDIEGCHFSIERINILCDDPNANITLKALFILLAGFFLFMGYVFYRKNQEMQYSY